MMPLGADKQQIGVIGLGRMGGGLSRQALAHGLEVVGFAQAAARRELLDAGLKQVAGVAELVQQLRTPRTVFLYIPAGPTIDTALDGLIGLLQPDDLVVDGGNSYWGDSMRRAERLRQHGLCFVDLGTSGGVEGAAHGACFMAGGEAAAVARIEPILRELCVPGGFVHAGGPGTGHFTKLVHNGIEFGMLQAIGEGIALLERHPGALPIADVLGCWRHGSVIRSWLIDLLEQEYRARGGLAAVPSYVDDTGEVNWLVSDALEMDVPMPVITQAVMQLVQSRDGATAARAVAVMRHGFGGHRLGIAPEAALERKTGRVGDIVRSGDGRAREAVRGQVAAMTSAARKG